MGYAEKIRKYRQSKVELDGKHITFLRPTDLDTACRPQTDDAAELMEYWVSFACDWDLVESDLIPGGNNESVGFVVEDFAEWLADRQHLWLTYINAVRSSYEDFKQKQEAEKKI